jgi:hypothetical protein
LNAPDELERVLLRHHNALVETACAATERITIRSEHTMSMNAEDAVD